MNEITTLNKENTESFIISTCICTPDSRPDDGYDEFENAIKEHFISSIQGIKNLYIRATNRHNELFEAFISGLPTEARQHYTCNTCRHFINRYGSLVSINDEGEAKSVIWNYETTPEFFKKSVEKMNKILQKNQICSVFYESNRITLGTQQTGKWTHLHVQIPRQLRNIMASESKLKSDGEMVAEKWEDQKMLSRALDEYSLHTIVQAVNILESYTLYRSDKCLAVVKWFKELHTKLETIKNTHHKTNLIWKAAIEAPVGFCHIKSSMIGTLLDDISNNLPFDSIKTRFAEKMNPLQYRRPQAAPTIGNIKRAEEIVEKLNIKNSFHRRFARLDEIQTIWKPNEIQKTKGVSKGMFSHLVEEPKETLRVVEIPTVTMTWVKFRDTILPNAKNIEYYNCNGNDSYTAITTSIYDDASPILKWDNEEKRNPFSHYVFYGGSAASKWNLKYMSWSKVTAITYESSVWSLENPNNVAIIFILENAKEVDYRSHGSAIFPEDLKSELNEIRATIEAYSKEEKLEGYDDASACGVIITSKSIIRVTTDSGTFRYKIDRWD